MSIGEDAVSGCRYIGSEAAVKTLLRYRFRQAGEFVDFEIVKGL